MQEQTLQKTAAKDHLPEQTTHKILEILKASNLSIDKPTLEVKIRPVA
jgi:hypothetical protein